MLESDEIKIPIIDSITSMEDIVQAYLDHETTKGLSIGVYDNEKISYFNYGICSDKNPVLPNNQSIYEIGSISKTLLLPYYYNWLKMEKFNWTISFQSTCLMRW